MINRDTAKRVSLEFTKSPGSICLARVSIYLRIATFTCRSKHNERTIRWLLRDTENTSKTISWLFFDKYKMKKKATNKELNNYLPTWGTSIWQCGFLFFTHSSTFKSQTFHCPVWSIAEDSLDRIIHFSFSLPSELIADSCLDSLRASLYQLSVIWLLGKWTKVFWK